MSQAQDQGEYLSLSLSCSRLTSRQCDEGQPGCKRCTQARKTCPGYPQVQLQFRPDFALAVRASNGRAYSASHLSDTEDEGDRDKIKTERLSSQPSSSTSSQAQRSISPPPRYDVHHQSLCFFLNLFCFQASRLYSFPVLDFLPDVLQKADPSSSIHQAAMAVSRLTLADRYSGNDIRLQTGREYGQALSLTNATIRNSAASVQDETVLAVWLLGLYEVSHHCCWTSSLLIAHTAY